jgi:hypothetical protein
MQSDEKDYMFFKMKNIIHENLANMHEGDKFLNKLKGKEESFQKYLDIGKDDTKLENFLAKEENNTKNILEDKLFYDEKRKNINESSDESIKEINQLELNALGKARELEHQVNALNRKRVEFIVKEFKEKLIEESLKDYKNFQSILTTQYNTTLTEINEKHLIKINQINKLNEQVNFLMEYCKQLSVELKDEKVDINSKFELYMKYLENEKEKSCEKYIKDMKLFIDNRIKIFKNHLEIQIFNNDK